MSFTFRPAKRERVPTGIGVSVHPTACICEVCSGFFLRVKHATGRYCGRKCAWIARGGPDFNAVVSRGSVEKRASAMRGSGEGRGYRKLFGRHEHRVVVERIIGRRLTFQEVVHHKDGNKLNNDPSNLVVMSRAEHMRAHGLAIPGQRSGGRRSHGV